MKSVIAVLCAAAFLAVAPAAAAPATAAPRTAPACPVHAVDHGTSLLSLSREAKVPIAVILWFAFRCSGYQGGGWTVRMAHYLSGGNMRAAYRGWYWLGPLT